MSYTFDKAKKGFPYCLTVKTTPCVVTVKGENNLIYTLITANEVGQYTFISPYYQLLISQDDAIITELDNENLEISNISNITNIIGKSDNSLSVNTLTSPSDLSTLQPSNAYVITGNMPTGNIDWSGLTFSFDPTKIDSSYILFKCANDIFPSITWPAAWTWINGSLPSINLNGNYLFVVMNTNDYVVANLAYVI